MLLKGLACSDFGRPGASCTLSSKVAHQALQGFVQCSAHTIVHAYSWALLQAAFLATLLYTGTLRQLYRNAMQMEVDFFSAQPGVSSAPSVGMLVIDFDDTCTATDTTSQVFNTAIAATVEASPGIYAICTCTHRQLGPMSCHIEPAALDMHATMTIADLVTVPESDKNQHASMHLASRHILCYPLRQTGLGATKAFPCCTNHPGRSAGHMQGRIVHHHHTAIMGSFPKTLAHSMSHCMYHAGTTLYVLRLQVDCLFL